jgi:hypothetical protein
MLRIEPAAGLWIGRIEKNGGGLIFHVSLGDSEAIAMNERDAVPGSGPISLYIDPRTVNRLFRYSLT